MQKSRASQMVLLAWIFFRVLGRCSDGIGLQDFATILVPCFPCAVPDSTWGPHPAQWSLHAAFCQGTSPHSDSSLSLHRLAAACGTKDCCQPSHTSDKQDGPSPKQGHQILLSSATASVLAFGTFCFFIFPTSFPVYHTLKITICGTDSDGFPLNIINQPLGRKPGILGWTPDTATSLASCSLLRTGTRS